MKKQQNRIFLIPLLIALSACATTPVDDPVIVQAQQTMETAKATFELLEKTEFETYAALKASNPKMATEVRTFVNKLRSDSAQWFTTTNALKESYRLNPTQENKDNLNRALAILQAATTRSNQYLAILPKS